MPHQRRWSSVTGLVTVLVLTGGVLVLRHGQGHAGVPRPRNAAARPRPPLVTSILGLGDSVPSGFACGCTPYVSLLAQDRSTREQVPVRAHNLAKAGLTSAGLLQQVRTDAVTATADAVTVVTIGANDFDSSVLSSPGCRVEDELSCYAAAVSTMGAHVLTTLRLLAGSGAHGPIIVTGYWNVFLDGPVGMARGAAYERDSDALTRQVNAAIAQDAVTSGALYVDLYTPFKSAGAREGLLLAPDGDHPSAAGHRLIARTLDAALVQHGI